MTSLAATRLAEVQTAISKLLTGGQSWTVNNRTFTRANLKDLMDLEKILQTQVNREANGGRITVQGAVPDS